MALVMDDTEIAIHYKLALDKRKDVKVMAELCRTQPQVIEDALRRKGVEIVKNKKPRKISGRREELARKLYAEGLSDRRIAAEIDASEYSVWKWRNKNGLPSQTARQKESAARR